MKANTGTGALAVLTLLLLLLLPTPLSNIARAEARSIRHGHALSVSRKARSSFSQVPRDLKADKRNPQKLVDSSFRRMPPSTSNPIGNNRCYHHQNVIELSLNITAAAFKHNYYDIKKLQVGKGLTERETAALHDCLETTYETLKELHQAVEDLHEYPN